MPTRYRRVTVRFSEAEYDTLRSKAQSLGLSMSQYLRLLTQVPLEKVSVLDSFNTDAILLVDSSTIRDLQREFSRQGNNLNQGAHAFNTLNLRYQRMDLPSRKTREMYKLAQSAKNGIDESLRIQKICQSKIIQILDNINTITIV